MILKEQVEWFLDPSHNHLTTRDISTQPGIIVTQKYLSAIEQIIIKTGAVFTDRPSISAGVRGPLSELVDIECDVSYLPLHYPEVKTPLCSTLIVSSYDLSAVNQLEVTFFPDVYLPWVAGTLKLPSSEYLKDYTPVNHYLRLIPQLLEEMSRGKLLLPGSEVKRLLPVSQ